MFLMPLRPLKELPFGGGNWFAHCCAACTYLIGRRMVAKIVPMLKQHVSNHFHPAEWLPLSCCFIVNPTQLSAQALPLSEGCHWSVFMVNMGLLLAGFYG